MKKKQIFSKNQKNQESYFHLIETCLNFFLKSYRVRSCTATYSSKFFSQVFNNALRVLPCGNKVDGLPQGSSSVMFGFRVAQMFLPGVDLSFLVPHMFCQVSADRGFHVAQMLCQFGADLGFHVAQMFLSVWRRS